MRPLLLSAALALLLAACAGPGAYQDPRVVVVDACQGARQAVQGIERGVRADRYGLDDLRRIEAVVDEYEALCVDADPQAVADATVESWLLRLETLALELEAIEENR